MALADSSATANAVTDVLTRETCLLSLDYAYYHVFFCVLQVALLCFGQRQGRDGRTKHFPSAHAFGLFAFVADYAVNYMTTGTRTLSYPNLATNLDGGLGVGDEAMGPVGQFLFFLWFDYGAFGLLVWAKMFCEYAITAQAEGIQAALRSLLSSPAEALGLIVVPFQFWTAPLLSPMLHIDPRQLLLARQSSKLVYTAMLLTFPVLLRFIGGMPWKRVSVVWLSGVGCGLIHHAPLFVYGMRGYSDTASLVITLGTEWPALILGVEVVEQLGGLAIQKIHAMVPSFLSTTQKEQCKNGRGKGHRIFVTGLWLALILLIAPHLAAIDDKDAMALLIPVVPGQHMQTVGTAFLRTRTCIMPRYMPDLGAESVNCWAGRDDEGGGNTGDDMLVMASAAKSGAVLSARLVVEIGISCGLCVASGERSAPGIPGPVEDLPVYDGKLLHAIINMRTWPDYVTAQGYDMESLLPRAPDLRREVVPALVSTPTASSTAHASTRVRCVTLIRDPLARLRSLYTYARSGGEHWFRYESGIMQRLADPSLTLQQSVQLFWDTCGHDYLLQSHEYMVMNIQLGCVPIKMEAFRSNFSDPVVQILRTYGVSEAAIPTILRRVASADLGSKSEAQRRVDAHVTANKFSPELVEEVKQILLRRVDGVADMIDRHRQELGY